MIAEALLEMWNQFAFPKATYKGLWNGGLSALEEAERELRLLELLDEAGNPLWENLKKQ